MQPILSKICPYFNFIEPNKLFCSLCNSNFILHQSNNPSRAFRHKKSKMHYKNEKQIKNDKKVSHNIENDIFLDEEDKCLQKSKKKNHLKLNNDKKNFKAISNSSFSSESILSCKLKKKINFLEAEITMRINKNKKLKIIFIKK